MQVRWLKRKAEDSEKKKPLRGIPRVFMFGPVSMYVLEESLWSLAPLFGFGGQPQPRSLVWLPVDVLASVRSN